MVELLECPQSVVKAGTRLVQLRRMAEDLEAAIDAALPDIRAAIAEVTKVYGAKQAEAGESLALLRNVQSAPGNIAHAHNLLRQVLGSHGIAEPTGKQIVAMAGETMKLSAEQKAALDADAESIR
jgi:hypothetical protein